MQSSRPGSAIDQRVRRQLLDLGQQWNVGTRAVVDLGENGSVIPRPKGKAFLLPYCEYSGNLWVSTVSGVSAM